MQAIGKTDTGMVREINQDYIYVSIKPVGPLPNLFLVADGRSRGIFCKTKNKFLFFIDYELYIF